MEWNGAAVWLKWAKEMVMLMAEIRRSPVEVGSTSQVGCHDFFHQRHV